MISNDGFIVVGGEVTIYPSLDEATFLDSSLGKNAQKGVFNAGYHSYHAMGKLVNGLECVFSVTFCQGTISMAGIAPRWPGLASSGWSNWSLENEMEIKRKNDTLLRQSLGPPPYQYEWGSISSQYDAKTGGSDIAVVYNQQ